MSERARISRDELSARIIAGDIDTVVMAFCDHHGRLTGKRSSGRFFLEHVAEAGTENCDYLLASDIDNTPIDGSRVSNAARGYGDMRARADWGTIRITPWVERTALILCDLLDEEDRPIGVAPRAVLQAQVDAAAAMGFAPMIGSEIEFYLFRETYEEAFDKDYRGLRPHSAWVEDYHVLQTTRDEYVIGQIRRQLEIAGVPVEYSKGEAGRGQHEINLDFATAVEMADRNTIYKTAAKEIAALNGRSVTFMAKYDMSDTGSSCHVHSSLWSLDGAASFAHDGQGLNDLCRHYLAGSLAAARDFALLWAPTVNSYKRFQPGSWAPTGVGWDIDNRTVGYRVVGHGSSRRIENRIPGADANSYHAFAGVIAAGLYGIRHRLELPPASTGNGYEATDVARIPSTLPEAIDLWERSDIARECFGDDVHHHVLTMARAEWRAFNAAVTDWELRRYWERA